MCVNGGDGNFKLMRNLEKSISVPGNCVENNGFYL